MSLTAFFSATCWFIAQTLVCSNLCAQQKTDATPASFDDITEASGIHFTHRADHSPMRYLIETMGSGVALFDYDNDGRLDIFAVNGAEIASATGKTASAEKTGPAYWNRLYHQRPDGTFEDVTRKAGLQASATAWGSQLVITITMAMKIFM